MNASREIEERVAREHTTNSWVTTQATTVITATAPRRISSRWSTAIRLGACAALIATALVWPFLSITSRAPGPPAAVIIGLPIMRRRTKRPREDEPNRSN
jgi:hypothetical protein